MSKSGHNNIFSVDKRDIRPMIKVSQKFNAKIDEYCITALHRCSTE